MEFSPDNYNTINTVNTEMLLYQFESDIPINDPPKTVEVCFTCSDHSEIIIDPLLNTLNINLDDSQDSVCSIKNEIMSELPINERIVIIEDSILNIK